jgi:hypothetical protein
MMTLNTRFHTPRCLLVIVAVFCVAGGACSMKDRKASAGTDYRLGDQIVLSPLTYTVVESKWAAELGEFPTQRIPERNFLLIRISVTNSGGSPVTLPFFTLENSAGKTFREVQDGAGVENWLGMLRTVKPAETEDGWILFDAPTNSYRLAIPDPADPDGARVVKVEIPLRLD